MPKGTPPPTDLLDVVREFIERDLLAELSGDLRFQCRVAINVLGIVTREMELGPAQRAAERQRLIRLLHNPGSVEQMNRELARRIREGTMGVDTPGLLEHLHTISAEALMIDNPKWIEP